MAVMTTVEVISHGMALLPNQRQIQGKDVYGNPKTDSCPSTKSESNGRKPAILLSFFLYLL